MMPPLILCLFMGTLALACVGMVVWQVGLLLAGAAWADVSFPLIMGQLGALFFGLFSLASWGQHKGEDVGAGIIHGLLLSLVLELTLLLGWSAWHMFDESYTLVTQGVEVQGRIVDYERRTSHSRRPISSSTSSGLRKVSRFAPQTPTRCSDGNVGAGTGSGRRKTELVPRFRFCTCHPIQGSTTSIAPEPCGGKPRVWECSVSFFLESACSSSRGC